MEKNMQTMDGNEAAAYVAYAFTEVAGIYPITPSSPIAEKTDEWSALGRKNLFGQSVKLVEMQSEAGAIGTVHGALEAGALATSYTSSQGLMLMIPTMYRLSGQRHPGVLHVAARTVGTHAFSIFGDHSDVMNCRQTGFAILSTSSVQEVMDLGGIAHLAAIKAGIPFMHFFDGFRTSHEVQKIDCIDYEHFSRLLDRDALAEFRANAMNPEHPTLRSTVQNPDIYFQVREASNADYDALPDIVQSYMDEINNITGRAYHLFDYYGAPDAEHIIVAMGSVNGTIQEVVDHLRTSGEKVGALQVHLYRPFSVRHFLSAIPDTVKRLSVIDRVKESGSPAEPLYEDICAAYANHARPPLLLGGRYGLSSKDTTPTQIKAVFENMAQAEPKNHFTVGIEDDVTMCSLPAGEPIYVDSEHTVNCKFWGLGSDGTVGANKNAIKIIGENTDLYTQAYFEYDTKKSFGITRSHLRFGHEPIRSSYLVNRADFIACHNQNFLRSYDIISELKPGGTFLLNCDWAEDQLDEKLPGAIKRYIAANDIHFYIINANQLARELHLGHHANMILNAAFFALADIIPIEDAVADMKEAVRKSYEKKGDAVVRRNLDAVERGVCAAVAVKIPAAWKDCADESEKRDGTLPPFINDILKPINALKGDELPVSAFLSMKDGTMPLGTAAYEKRNMSTQVPVWNSETCSQCNMCSYVCSHAVVRPYLLSSAEAEQAPPDFVTVAAKGAAFKDYSYSLQISVADCTGCGCCAAVCPGKEKSLTMLSTAEAPYDPAHWEYALSLSDKKDVIDVGTVRGSQFKQPLLEFSGACAGCGETPYVKLLTQLYGDKIYIANGTGCSQAWGAAMPSIPYTTNKEGRGPAWSNSLFENNAEFSLGMYLAVRQQREAVARMAEELLTRAPEDVAAALRRWFETYDDLDESQSAGDALVELLEHTEFDENCRELAADILSRKDQLNKKTMWMVGGDGWAYDIGYGGLDHVFAMGEDVNVLLIDTEVYSNTGGQSSKATQLGAVAQFAYAGKSTRKKDLGLQMMSYGNVYVAQVAMGANPAQLLKALREAERHPGPSVVIAYSPCIAHGIRAGMSHIQQEMKDAVDAGYWFLYRYDPLRKDRPFILDSGRPGKAYAEFLKGEVRFSALEKTFPEHADRLFAEAERISREKYADYERMAAAGERE